MRQTVEEALTTVAGWFAIAGGAVLVAITAMTVVSITGRELNWLGFSPVPGDYELVEAGTAFAIFAFLPWCQMKRGHVTVDLFLARFGPRLNAAVDVISNILMTAVAVLIAWRLWLGMLDKKAYQETTFILQFPLWWAYAAAMTGAVFFALVCLYTIWRSLDETLAPSAQSPEQER
ncbi:TRAP transporter small permease [Stappia stellulata]|uniref:TRAP transporter small permease n=1 Tax=Stappia stellulata TaxID=71235 RepID=UPI0004147173|nr:TRAP transporter small permease [Stappia stellulata]